MKIAFVEIQNFRKLKSCRIEIAAEQTVLVGANNSGKTSAIDAMILFLKKNRRKNIATTDFTLSNWTHINQIGVSWTQATDITKLDLTLGPWSPYLPCVDLWLQATDADVHHVIHLLPTLDWSPKEKLGLRLVLAPKKPEDLYKAYSDAYLSARKVEASGTQEGSNKLSLWPQSMRDFLDRELQRFFEVTAYILDPAKCSYPLNGLAVPQSLPVESVPIDAEPIDHLLRIDVISAQRGFSDPKTEDDSHIGFASLSSQLRQYFDKHLNPSDSPGPSDIEALQAIEEARKIFDEKLKNSFRPAIGELEGLNYPGFSDPRISLTSKIQPVDALDHEAAVQFNVSPDVDDAALALPEKYNGLGYQNLISMVFSLIRFRDEWMRVGKAAKKQDDDEIIQPLHIVLVEEPEAHLHAQVQQVFIKKAYGVLRNNSRLKTDQFNTQMIVSTHSSHVAHELAFTCLRYFRREPASKKGEVPSVTVINLSNTFGSENDTSRFAARYIRSTDCDLFFADAVILVEGSAERMLIPHFIRHKFPDLDKSYVALLEIGGSHAHRLRPLLETLGILTLIITDLDSIGKSDASKVFPERKKQYRTGNTTLSDWIPKKPLLDDLFDCSADGKQSSDEKIRVAYQHPISLNYKDASTQDEAIPYTFEDALALTNQKLFRTYKDPSGLIKKLHDAFDKTTLSEANKAMYEGITGKNTIKAQMALELLFLTEPDALTPPLYISDGLTWLEGKLAARKCEFLSEDEPKVTNG